MRQKIKSFFHQYFNEGLDFRAQIFNLLGFLGIVLGLFFGVYSMFNYTGIWNVVGNFGAAVTAIAIIYIANRTGSFKPFFLITVILVFLVIFPVLFFMGGGYKGSMPCFFVFAAVFTVIMLEGRRRTAFILLELALYLGCLLTAYFRPDMIVHFKTEADVATDIIVGCLASSVVLALTIIRHIKLYDKNQKALEKANDALSDLNRVKTEFLSNISHEMRTPLTVISVNVQTAIGILSEMSETDSEAMETLQNAQSEVMRLGRMVGGLLTLTSMSENTDKQRTDFSALLQSGVEMLRLSLSGRGNSIQTDIENGLVVFGNADLLAQVATNLLHNAGAHTENGVIALTAAKNGNEISVTVRDTGTGIAPELLPRVFERGVTTGGTGFGLHLCKMVVESHGGRIWIESEPGKGTAVSYTLPFYQGQIGGEK